MTGFCQIWWGTLAMVRDRHLDLLSGAERARRSALRRPEGRERFTVAAVLLRLAVGARTGQAADAVGIVRSCPDCDRPHGKPTLADHSLEVSVSHAGERVVVALTDAGPVGVDVERLDRAGHLAGMDRRVYSPAESVHPSTDPTRDFYTCWTRKESVLKATGDGLRVPMPTLTLAAADQPARLLAFADRPDLVDTCTVRDLNPGSGYVAAVTVLAAGPLHVAESSAVHLLT